MCDFIVAQIFFDFSYNYKVSVFIQGRELVTGLPGDEVDEFADLGSETPDYFRIHVNQYNSVETITCVFLTVCLSNCMSLKLYVSLTVCVSNCMCV